MNILITGGAGFQGSHLAKRLIDKGHKVTILNTDSPLAIQNLKSKKIHNKVNWVRGSITDKEIVTKTARNCDVVFHLAARIHVDESIHDPVSTIEVNVLGTTNVLEAVRHYGRRMIHASTSEVYGSVKEGYKAINEEHELRPQSPYAASKAAADRICYAYYKTYGIDVTIVRPFNIFGEGQKEGQGGALIPILVKRAMDGLPLQIYGKGDQTRDYTYISDLVEAYMLIFESSGLAGEVINFGTGEETKVVDIVQYIAGKFNIPVEHLPPRPGEVARLKVDFSKAQKLLGFKPQVNVWQGIDRYIRWRKQLTRQQG